MKWRSIVRTPAPAATALSDADPPLAGASETYLRAIPAKFGNRALQGAELDVGEGLADRPNPNALLRYYRSALRADPRGALTQSDDRHGVSFQLVTGAGDWSVSDGQEALIRITLDHLPGEFREALFRRVKGRHWTRQGKARGDRSEQ